MIWAAIWRALFGPGTWGAGGNIVAAAILGVPGAALAWWKRDHIGRAFSAFWGRWHPHKDALAEIRATADAAHRIAADLYEHHTGYRHPDSPLPATRPDE